MTKNSRLGLWLLIPACILTLAARTVQICAGTDMNSGFLKHDNGFLMNFCFWGAVVLTLAAGIAAAVLDRKRGGALYTVPVSGITGGRAAAIGFALLIVAMAALYEGYREAVIPEGNNISPLPFLTVVNFLFGGIMLVTAFVILYLKEFKPALGFAVSAGAVYYTLRGIGIFLERMAITTVPEYLINCMSIILAAVFFMQLARLLSGNEGKRTREALAVSGAVAAATILGSSAAAAAAAVAGPAEVASRIVFTGREAEILYQLAHGKDAYFMSFTPVSTIAGGVFIIVALIALSMKPGTAQEPASAEEQPEEGIPDISAGE